MTMMQANDLRRRRLLVGFPMLVAAGLWQRRAAAQSVPGSTLHLGPDRELKTFGEAAKRARDGDTILADPGDYRGDVAVWNQSGITIKGEGGQAALYADGASAAGKGIFVVRGRDVRIENLRFSGARVRDRNGAGVRLEGKGQLTVERCHFEDNENGILTANDPVAELHIADSVFVDNGAGDGQSHNLYVGSIDQLTVIGSYFARGRVGHLLKSRARTTTVGYSRLSGEEGTASYELEFPAGGRATVIGCVIQQGAGSQNSTIVSYGAEGYRWEENVLTISFCTLVNDRPGAGSTFVRAAKGNASVTMDYNLLNGSGSMDLHVPGHVRNTEVRDSDFADAARFDFRLRRKSRAAGAAGLVGALPAEVALPTREYVHPASSEPLQLRSALTPLSPGAFQRLAP